MYKPEKQKAVQDLIGSLKNAKSVVLVNYAGMNIKLQQDLKKQLKATNSSMSVVKNTLFRIASKELKFPDELTEDKVLSGQTALIISDTDPVSPISIIGKFAKESDLPKFKVGLVEGIFQSQESLLKLSKLPGKEQLQADLLGTLMTPMYSFVSTLNAKMQEVISILDAKAR